MGFGVSALPDLYCQGRLMKGGRPSKNFLEGLTTRDDHSAYSFKLFYQQKKEVDNDQRRTICVKSCDEFS